MTRVSDSKTKTFYPQLYHETMAAADTTDQNLIKLYARHGCASFVVRERIVGGPYE